MRIENTMSDLSCILDEPPRAPLSTVKWHFEPCGDRCVILIFGSVFSIDLNRQAASVGSQLRTLGAHGQLPGVTDVVSAMVTVGVHPDTPSIPATSVSRMLFAALKRHPRLSCVPHNESAPPSLQPHYRSVITNTGKSVPILTVRAEDRFSRSPKRPGSGSCCLNNGCRAVGRQVSSALLGVRLYKPVLTPVEISSRHQSVHFRSTA
ncbi:carboxyltransferase domain-containing protein [Pseudomonas sp. W22_MBD1_FP4]|uniref:carboxyltransferase domain-containing protein n=1 Tax=Pseudomonas sp. W22_MBD1_FP4 TaxID=3240272 RepID=UPI003F987884